jgi:type I restriction enzyme S subunit
MMQSIPQSWRTVRIGDLTLFVERKEPRSLFLDTFSYIDISAVDNGSKTVVGSLSLKVNEAPSRARQVVFPDDILVSTVRPRLNAVALVPYHLLNAIASTGFCVLRPRSNLLLPGYLFHFVTTDPFVQCLVSRQKGGSYPAVTDGDVLSVLLPLPPLSEQQRIVEILQETDEIRRLRAEAEAKTAELIPAIFAIIFGDLYFRKSPFPVQPLSSIGELDRGKSKHRPRDEASLYGGPYPFLQTGDIAQANGWITNYTQTYSEKGLEQSRLWPKGTLAITIAANIGATAILTFDACFPDSVVGFTPNNSISVEYVRWWLLGYQKKLEVQAAQGAQKNINLEVLRSIQIPVPPRDLQLKFQAAIQNLREQIDAAAAGAKSLTSLSSSLSAYAFSGQLTAAWRKAHQEMLALEASDRDAALEETGAPFSRSRRATIQEMESIGEQPTEGIYSNLNHEKRNLLLEIARMVGGVRYARYFSAQLLSEYISDGPLRRNPQAIEGHLSVFAARGLIIPVSREEQSEDTGGFFFGNAYRLPLDDHEPKEGEEGEPRIGDHSRLRELDRIAAQLGKDRALT